MSTNLNNIVNTKIKEKLTSKSEPYTKTLKTVDEVAPKPASSNSPSKDKLFLHAVYTIFKYSEAVNQTTTGELVHINIQGFHA